MTQRRQSLVALYVLAVCGALLGLALPLHAADSMRTQADANEIGIWKAYVPHGVKGEFDSYDPVGLMAGTLIHADCSINWRDPDTHKLFCFSTGTSFNYFRDFPKANTVKAEHMYERLRAERPGS